MCRLFFAAICLLICVSCSSDVKRVEKSEERPLFIIPSSDKCKGPVLRFTASKDTSMDKRDVANDLVAEQWYRNLIRWSESSSFK